MGNIHDALDQFERIDRLVVTCNVCGSELYDTAKNPPSMGSKSYLAALTKAHIKNHQRETEHSDINLNLTPVELVREVNTEITVTTNRDET